MVDFILLVFVLAVAAAGFWIGWYARGQYSTWAELKASANAKVKAAREKVKEKVNEKL